MRFTQDGRTAPAANGRGAFSRRGSAMAFALILGMLAGAPADAADVLVEPVPEAKPPAPEWSFDVTPYFWMASLSGTASAFGAPPVDVDMRFGDILKDLHMSVMLASQARRGRFSLSTDLIYISMSSGASTPFQVLADRADLKVKTLEMTALAGYAVVDDERVQIDLVGGPRLWHVEDTIALKGGLLNGRSFSDQATWVDAMAGVRGRFALTERIHLTGTALAGGGSSAFAWDVLGGLSYDVGDNFSATIGYRGLGVDYDDDGFEFDMKMHGPMIGATLRF
ncbi:hypothetical protein RDV64_05220 [Acuticoccus sp. MNP-M23]|uniref:outer membrane protein n=1 Tax=Acuticoccus sp. MNP-M23 TaxID=3072793 RepID=UPI00281645BF|nr:hypothetical protein [Acuticoccus sp. MNP-M23]WMS43799.1 hypothetical protein RDV64_05220 [Acuticoccus sp. MNP-M23]